MVLMIPIYHLNSIFLLQDDINATEINIKPSNEYTSTIIIDTSGGGSSYTWTEAVTAGICTGSGTSVDPYVIENHQFNLAAGAGNCLRILSSTTDYFIVRNCEFSHSGSPGASDYGIFIDDCANGAIINNQIQNSYYSIYLSTCEKCEISGNTITDSSLHGIRVFDGSKDNMITNNVISNSNQYGILLYGSDIENNTISGNTLNNNGDSDVDSGIYLDMVHHNIIKENTFNDNFYAGIYSYACQNNTYTGNTCDNNGAYGFFMTGGKYNIIKNNYISSNIKDGIYLGSASASNIDKNIIFENTIANNGVNGLTLFQTGTNIISGNTILNNKDIGIYCDETDGNIIISNVISGNHNGITLATSYYNSISGNYVYQNSYNIIEDVDCEGKNLIVDNYYTAPGGPSILDFLFHPFTLLIGGGIIIALISVIIIIKKRRK